MCYMIHVVKSGESIDTIALQYGISPYDLAFDNQIEPPYPLVVGQALWVQVNTEEGMQQRENRTFFGYAYPFIEEDTLLSSLPYLRQLYNFSYGYTDEGELVPLADENLLLAAARFGVESVLVLTPFSREGTFSNQLVNVLVENRDVEVVLEDGSTQLIPIQQRLTDELLIVMQEKGFSGIDVDFEYILPEDKENYVEFIRYLVSRFSPYGYRVTVALPPKISDDQPGLLYEGMDYEGIGEAADAVLLMTYEWGYTYGPPMAVAPIPSVRRVLDYAITRIPANKIYMGLPNYGYDWPLPYVRGETKAETIGYLRAIELAREYGVEIQYDEVSQSPFFRYVTGENVEHEVWFEDVRSMQAKFQLISEYGFLGGGYWNLLRFFRANWLLQASLFI